MKNISRFYRVSNSRLVFPGVERGKLTVGETYNIGGGLITDGFYGETHQLYFYEYSKPGDNVFIMTDKKGLKPFAVATNDCTRDDFPEHCLAKVLVEPGNNIIFSYAELDSNEEFTGNHNVIVFRITELSPNVFYSANSELSVNATVISRDVVSSHTSVKYFKEAIRHILLVGRRTTDDYTTPKYCFNPGRVVNNRLFHRDEEGELVSFNENDKRLVLNRNSTEGDIIDERDIVCPASNLFLRCFYSKKHMNEETIFIDGAKLTMLQEKDIEDYIDKSNLTRELAASLIRKAITEHDETFYVVVNVKAEIRPIYINSYGYATFPLTEKEKEFIKSLEEVKF
jgi:hypothetical protein